MADKLKGKPGSAGWRHAVWVFIKAQLSSYVASLIDFLVTILLVKLSGLFYLYATFLGSVVGGVVNCVINYGWVFHADDCKKTHVALKYLFVWGGSILLNTWGHVCPDRVADGYALGGRIAGHYINDVFILSKIIVAILVAFFGTIICNGYSYIVIIISGNLYDNILETK